MKKLFTVLLAAILCVALFAGCTQTPASSAGAESKTPDASQAGTPAEKDPLGADFEGYPVKDAEGLEIYNFTGWTVPDGVAHNDNVYQKQLAERTGININWLTVPAGGESGSAFNLMISGSDLPDMIYASGMPGMAAQLIEDGKIITLDDKLATYAPAYYKFITADKAYDNSVKTDAGNYYGFAFFRENLVLGTYNGPQANVGAMEATGLPVPETIDEWDTMLRKMKEQGVEFPFTARGDVNGLYGIFGNAFGAYGNAGSAYGVNNDGKIVYNWTGEGYKEFLDLMKTWYADGLIDPDFMSQDGPALEEKVINNRFGLSGFSGGTMVGYEAKIAALEGNTVKLQGLPRPTKNKGDKITYMQGETPNIGIVGAITTSCKNVELACRWYDYGYTEEGMIFANYGDEEWYDMVDGKPVWKEAWHSDPRGNSVMMSTYTAMSGNSATLNMMSTLDSFPESRRNAVLGWYVEDAVKNILPGAMTMSIEENESITSEMQAIQTSNSEMIANYILGKVSDEDYAKYEQQIKDQGLDHVLEVYQTVYDRYLAR